MSRTNETAPWYVAGLAFECLECGRCCAGPEEGYVWVTDKEIRTLATSLRLDEKTFRARYVRTVGRRKSLVEKKPGNDCIFLKNGKCTVYEIRPMQCRTWPFWPSNISSPDDWSYAAQRCPGINRGRPFSPAEIQERAHATNEGE